MATIQFNRESRELETWATAAREATPLAGPIGEWVADWLTPDSDCGFEMGLHRSQADAFVAWARELPGWLDPEGRPAVIVDYSAGPA